ncbi:hypothetical protein AAFA46_02290 [Oscillospiraceae bacterium WX1]
MAVYFLIFTPILAFACYTLFSYRKLPDVYDLKLTRRVYYIFVLLYLAVLFLFYRSQVENTVIIHIDNVNNLFVNYAIFLVLAVVWEYLFISCRTLKNFKFKDIELDMTELDQVKYVDKTQDRQIASLDAVLNARIEMAKFVNDYVKNSDLNPEQSYKDIIREYEKKRKNVKVFAYFEHDTEQMAKELSISKDVMTALMYAISLYGYCIPKAFRKKDYIFAKYKTKYTTSDIIVVFSSDFLVDNEHLMLFDAVDYFEVLIGLNILQAENENLGIQNG